MKLVRYCVIAGFIPLFASQGQQAPASWVPVGTASVSDMAANANGALWAIALDPRASGDKQVLKWNGSAFEAQPITAKRIAVDPSGIPWIVTSAGDLSYLGSPRVDAPLKAVDVAVGANGAVWAIGADDGGVRRLVNGAWQSFVGSGTRIAVDPQGNPWVVNAGNRIWRWTGTVWQLLEGTAQDVSVSADGRVYIVGTKLKTGGFEIQEWNGTGWNTIPDAGGAVVAAGKKLYIALHGSKGSLVYATDYQPTTLTATSITAPATTAAPITSPTSPTTATVRRGASPLNAAGSDPITPATTTTTTAGSITLAPPPPISIGPTPVIKAAADDTYVRPPAQSPGCVPENKTLSCPLVPLVPIATPQPTATSTTTPTSPTTATSRRGASPLNSAGSDPITPPTTTPTTAAPPNTAVSVPAAGAKQNLPPPNTGVEVTGIVQPTRGEETTARTPAKTPPPKTGIEEIRLVQPTRGDEITARRPSNLPPVKTDVPAVTGIVQPTTSIPAGEEMIARKPVAPTTESGIVSKSTMNPLAAPIPGSVACPIIVGNTRLEKGCALNGEDAAFVAKAPSTTCANGSFADPQNGGECWTCPANFIRNVSPVASNDACWKPIGETLSIATRVGKIGCEGGNFVDPRNGGECWSCPAGYNRTLDPVTAFRACSQGIFGPFSKAKYGGKPLQSCTAPSFWDGIDGGTCWTCPDTYRRTANSVKSDGACAKTYDMQYSVATQQNGCSIYPTPVGYGTPFRLARNGGECLACPVPLLHTASAANNPASGNFALCSPGGTSDRLVWQSPQYPEPGAYRFMPGLIEMALADPKVVEQFLMMRAGGDVTRKRALWSAMIADPASSAELKALVFASLLTAAKNDVSGNVRQSLAEFESYARARRVFVAQETGRMHDAWQVIDEYNRLQKVRLSTRIVGASSSVLGAPVDYQRYAWNAAAPDSAGVELVVAIAALGVVGEALAPSTFNNNNPSVQLQYLQPVSFAIGNGLETLAQKGGLPLNKAASLTKVLAGGLKQLGANAFFVALTLVNSGIDTGYGINVLTTRDKLAGEYAKLVTDANRPVSVKSMLESKNPADARALLLFWSLATSPSSANAKLSQGKISGASLCSSDQWTTDECSEVKSLVAAAAKAAGN